MASILEMAAAVGDLAELERRRLDHLDDMTLRLGYDIGRGYEGLRVAVARAAGAAQLLADLGPHEEPLLVWLAARRLKIANEATPPSP